MSLGGTLGHFESSGGQRNSFAKSGIASFSDGKITFVIYMMSPPGMEIFFAYYVI
jgi:hypothetical protein